MCKYCEKRKEISRSRKRQYLFRKTDNRSNYWCWNYVFVTSSKG